MACSPFSFSKSDIHIIGMSLNTHTHDVHMSHKSSISQTKLDMQAIASLTMTLISEEFIVDPFDYSFE